MAYHIPAGDHVISEAVVDTYGTKYFLLVLDDFNQNHLNKGLVSIMGTSNIVDVPTYYRGDLSFNCALPNNPYQPDAPRRITQAQLYSLNEIIKNRNDRTTDRVTGPTTTDILAMIPIKKHGLSVGDPYIEFGTTLQSNERIYFGPVNIERLRIRLVDDKGNTVNLHGNDWSFSLIASQLYQY